MARDREPEIALSWAGMDASVSHPCSRSKRSQSKPHPAASSAMTGDPMESHAPDWMGRVEGVMKESERCQVVEWEVVAQSCQGFSHAMAGEERKIRAAAPTCYQKESIGPVEIP